MKCYMTLFCSCQLFSPNNNKAKCSQHSVLILRAYNVLQGVFRDVLRDFKDDGSFTLVLQLKGIKEFYTATCA